MTIKDSGNRTQYETGAVRDMKQGKGRMDLLPWRAIIELSKHCENGAIKYGERNVDKGLPVSSMIDSAFRHMAKYMEGETDEDHLIAALWNIAWAVQFEHTLPDMQDIPNMLKCETSKHTYRPIECETCVEKCGMCKHMKELGTREPCSSCYCGSGDVAMCKFEHK